MSGYRPRLLEHEKTITPLEKEKLLAYLATPEVMNTRVAAMMTTVMKTGLRASELCHLKVEHCILGVEYPRICVWGGKKRRADECDTIRVSKDFAAYLTGWINRREPLVYVFEGQPSESLTRNTVWNDFKRIYRELGFSKKYGVHSLRHRYITDAYKAFKDPVIAMNQARHKNLAVTTRYIHLASEESQEFGDKLSQI